MTIKGGATLESRDKNNFLLCNVSANTDSGLNINRHILMNNYDIGGGSNVGAKNATAVTDILANIILKGRHLDISHTSTCTSDISAPNIYTKTQVDSLLTRRVSSSDINNLFDRIKTAH